MARAFAVLCVALTCVSTIFGQENTQTSIPASLKECYNTTEITVKENKLPMSINVLINLIQKIESDPSSSMDLKIMVTSILHRFRQDGIEKAHGRAIQSDSILPYSPRGRQFNKFKFILQDLVPGNSLSFPNETLNRIERCSLHSMLSDSIEFRERGDEGQVCSRLSKFQMRVSRSVKEDVEILDPKVINKRKRGNIQSKLPTTNPNKDVDVMPQNRGYNDNAKQFPKSECPVENGVIFTRWGAISGGNVLAGIAAGVEYMSISMAELGVNPQIQVENLDNIWGATLAGDLAEAVIYQTTKGFEIGASGGWNSTQVPRWYFLSKNSNVYMTDAEIRGGIDGLILGKMMDEIKSKISKIKLSQLLDMYYSQKGVLTADTRACRRRELYKKFAPTDEIQQQTTAFGIVFDKRVTTDVSFEDQNIYDLAKVVAEKLDRYIPSMNDLACDTDEYRTISTDVIIAVDSQWPFEQIYPILSYLLENIDINLYNSNFTLLNAKDGAMIVNSSFNLVDFHENFNQSSYNQYAKGFDITKAVRAVEDIARSKMELERRLQENGGRSMIGLFIPSITAIDQNDKNLIVTRINDIIKTQVPDLKFLALTPGAKDSFNDIVQDSSRDVFTINPSSEGTLIMQSVAPLITRIKEVPIRFAYCKCGSDWSSKGSDKMLAQYVQAKNINFYKLSPNYFFGDGTRRVKIRGQGFGVLSVCHSRSNNFPRANNTKSGSDDITCKQINADEYVITLTDACSGHDYIKDCPPLYISVEAPQSAETGRYSCYEDGCRYPDNIKFTMSMENMGCFSSAASLLINSFLIVTCAAVLRFINYI